MSNHNPHYISRLGKDTLALILAGGRGARLHELTNWRAKSALFFAGNYRLIDFPLSNCVNSGIRRVGVLTQYKSHSLVRHLIAGWSQFKKELGEFVEILPASQRFSKNWYQGTADALYQNLDIIRAEKPKYVLVLAGDHICKMDYGNLLVAHVQSKAQMTVACLEVPVEEAAMSYGVLSVDNTNRVTGFAEKPAHPSPIPGQEELTLASLGNYVFDTEFLFRQLLRDAATKNSTHEFGSDIIPRIIRENHIHAYPFRDGVTNKKSYWRNVATIDAYWQANLELVDTVPPLNIYDPDWPVWTYQMQLPPAKFSLDLEDRQGYAVDSMVCGGCIVSGAKVERSLLYPQVKVHSYSDIQDCVILPKVNIGKRCKIRKAIIDRSCHITDGMTIGYDHQQDRENGFRVTDKGVVLVTRSMLGQKRTYREVY